MIFGHNYFISEPIFKLFVACFRTRRSYFSRCVTEIEISKNAVS